MSCQNGNVGSTQTCANGCQTNPAGVADSCKSGGGGGSVQDGKLVMCEPFKPAKPVTCGYGCYGGHQGSDYACADGTPVYAPISGKVTKVVNTVNGQTCSPNFGNYVKIATGAYEVILAHMRKDIQVGGGDIDAGTLVGYASNSGYTLTQKGGQWVCMQGGGWHLHLEVRKSGVPLNAQGSASVVWSNDCAGGGGSTNFCTGKQSGLWCDGDKLVNCQGGAVGSTQTCADGCQTNPAGVADSCKGAPASFCSGKQNGLWCDGDKLVDCQKGAAASNKTCADGCQSNPPGTADACKGGGVPDFCAGKADGTHCDGETLRTCAAGAIGASEPCGNGCGDQPDGAGDACKAAQSDWCGAKPDGSYCDANQRIDCKAGAINISQVCPFGCQVSPKGVADFCKTAPTPCTDKADGSYCKGDTLVVCWQAAVANEEVCADGCGVDGKTSACLQPVQAGACGDKPDGSICMVGNLVTCAGGDIVDALACNWGCADGGCEPPPPADDWCVSRADGVWCNGNVRTTCAEGVTLASETCDLGCVSSGGGPVCAQPAGGDPLCAEKGDGFWCDGVKRVTCWQGAAVAALLCPFGCVAGVDGEPDTCNKAQDVWCESLADGVWCDGDDLVTCAAGTTTSSTTCLGGCVSSAAAAPAGTPDHCNGSAGFCADKSNGAWCNGAGLVSCSAGDAVSEIECPAGCSSQPWPLPDVCSSASDFCTGKADGAWCDGAWRVSCSGGDETARSLCGWGCEAGGPDASCGQLGVAACQGQADGKHCEGNVLVSCTDNAIKASFACLNGCTSLPGEDDAACNAPAGPAASAVTVVVDADGCATFAGNASVAVLAQSQLGLDDPLGTCAGMTITSDGSSITSMSMIYQWFGLPRTILGVSGNTPSLENAWRTELAGYLACPAGEGTCCVDWHANPGLLGWLWLPTPTSGCIDAAIAEQVAARLNAQQPVIAGVHWVVGGHFQHWVVVAGVTDGVLMVIDPYGGGAPVPLAQGALGDYLVDAFAAPTFGSFDSGLGVVGLDGQPIATGALPDGLDHSADEVIRRGGGLPTGGVQGHSGSAPDSGCGVRGRQSSGAGAWLLLFAALALVGTRRRRRIAAAASGARSAKRSCATAPSADQCGCGSARMRTSADQSHSM